MKQSASSDSVVDSVAAIALVVLIVGFAVLWVSGQ